MMKNKKGMEIGGLYNFVLGLVLIGFVIGIGIVVLDKFQNINGMTDYAAYAVNETKVGIGSIGTDWMSLIVIVAVVSVILFMVIRAFRGGGSR